MGHVLMGSTQMENRKFLIYTAIAACMICVIAIAFNVFTDMELPGRIMAAILGVVITATITQLLLQGQTQKEGALKRSSKIFEEKLKIYQNFINILYNAVKDGKLTDNEKMELQFQTSLVAMHCNPENIINVSEAVRRVVNSTCPSGESGSVGETDLLKSLFSVVEAFRMDLYESDAQKFDKDIKDKTIENFSKAFCEAQGGDEGSQKPQRLAVDLNILSGALNATLPAMQQPFMPTQGNGGEGKDGTPAARDTDLWDKAVAAWEHEWMVNGLTPDNGNSLTIKPRDEDNPAEISMGFYDNHYYIQAAYRADADFSKALKWDNGGRRSYGAWWEYLPGEFYDIPSGKLYETFASSKALQEHVIKRVNYLMEIIRLHHRTSLWKKALGQQDQWHVFVWYWKCLACEWQTEKEGKVYFDIMAKDGDERKAVFWLGNRSKDAGLLKQTLARIGCQDKVNDINDDCCVNIGEVTAEAGMIAEMAREWTRKISG